MLAVTHPERPLRADLVVLWKALFAGSQQARQMQVWGLPAPLENAYEMGTPVVTVCAAVRPYS